ncbi:MAG: hypothetical protein ACFB21_10195 [Opitutales bacterium]
MLLAQSGVRDDEAGPTGPAIALAALLCIQNHLDQFTDPSGKMVLNVNQGWPLAQALPAGQRACVRRADQFDDTGLKGIR